MYIYSKRVSAQVLYFPILFILALQCRVFAKTNPRYYLPNYFTGTKEEIKFERLSPISFTYSVSSCVLPEFCAHNLFDSNPNTDWTTGKDSSDEWVVMDFGSKRLMNSLEISISRLSEQIPEIQTQVLFHEQWKTIHTLKNPTEYSRIKFGSIDASVIRVLFPKKKSVNYIIKDLKILLNDSILTGIPARLSGYMFPVENGILPADDYAIPGAPRKYRNGIHKGLDITQFKDGDVSRGLTFTTPIYAPKDGVIVRADWDYVPMTKEVYDAVTKYNQEHGVTYVDKDFGGRQIWIDHQNGVMTSFNHLSSISYMVKYGTHVKKGDLIGYAGNSGLLPEALGNGKQIHLHLEIWIDGEFLGNDMNSIQMRKFLQMFFSN